MIAGTNFRGNTATVFTECGDFTFYPVPAPSGQGEISCGKYSTLLKELKALTRSHANKASTRSSQNPRHKKQDILLLLRA